MSRRSFAKRILIALILIAAVMAALYAATPAIVSKLSPAIAGRFGLTTLEVEIDHPRLRSVHIRRLVLSTGQLELRGVNARADFSWRELVRGRLDRLVFAELSISVSPAGEAAPTDEPAALDPEWFVPPVGYLSAEKLRLEFSETGFVGVGQASLGNGLLSFMIEGVAPEAASRLALSAELTGDGAFNARFLERGDASLEYLRLDGMLEETTVELNGQVSLKGFALELVSEILGVAPGSGTVSAAFETTLPWPLPDAGEWPRIDAAIPTFDIDWQSADQDLRLQNIRGSAVVSGDDASGSVAGTIALRLPERDASVVIPDEYRLELKDGTLSGQAGLRLRLKDADSDTRATVRSFSFVNGPVPILALDTDVVSRIDTVDIRGRARLNVTGAEALRVSGQFDFDGDAAIGDQRRRGTLKTNFTLDNGQVSAGGMLSSGIFDNVPFELEQNVDTGAGAFSATKLVVFDKALAASIIPGWQEAYDLDGGRIDAALKLNWKTPDKIEAQLTLALDKVRAHYEKDTAKGISAILTLRSADASKLEAWRLEPSRVTVQRIDVGLPITDLRMSIMGSADQLGISELEASLLGGRAFADAFDYAVGPGSADVSLRLEDIDLARVLALEGDDIVGTGRLDGVLPVAIRNSRPSVQNGTIAAQPPGGTIKLTPAFAGPTGQAGLDFALLALKDFRYSQLQAEVNYAENGDLALAVHLMGRNPKVEKGRAILYNLNISENIPVLLESLHLQDRLSEKIEKRIK